MKMFIKTAVILTYFALGVVIAQSQQFSSSVKPDYLDTWMASAKTVPAQNKDQLNTKFVIALFSADATVRALDGYSTVKLLNDPCRCFHESDCGGLLREVTRRLSHVIRLGLHRKCPILISQGRVLALTDVLSLLNRLVLAEVAI